MHEYEREHNEFLRRFGAECTVLLKTDGTFPLDGPCELALYGSGARHTVKGGTGSGEVNSRTFVTAEEGLEAAGFHITSKNWIERYGQLRQDAKKRFIRDLKRSALKRGTLAVLDSMGAVMPEPEYEIPLNAAGDAAVYVLSRISGEGSDRRPIPGDILLTDTEKRDILALERKYRKFLLVLNTGGVIDLSPVMEVRNILLLGQLGGETGNILADIILGRSQPSGKLTTTWYAWEDHPGIGSFGDRYDTRYTEGVYVGYRYFDSAGKKPLFPFGFGLSYTRFDLKADNMTAGNMTAGNMTAGNMTENAGRICISVSVRNVGDLNGKEVVQLYVSPPQGRLDKPYQALAAFEKTDDLKPGEEQTLTLSFDLRDLASYDEEHAAWILEPGDYVIRIGSSSRDTKATSVIRLDREAIIRKGKNCLGSPGDIDWKPEPQTEGETGKLPTLLINASAFHTEIVDYTVSEEIDPLIESLNDEELCLLNIGAFNKKGPKSVIGAAGKTVAGASGETVGLLKKKGIPALIMADGPAGLRLSRQYTRDEKGVHSIGSNLPESAMELLPAPAAFFIKHFSGNISYSGNKSVSDNEHFSESKNGKGEVFEQNCSAIPIGTSLAQSWNLRFAEQCGDLVGNEMERFGVHLWLAPALNIHRDIRCDRNFEYYSEDPLISGRFAAAVTRGVQKHNGCGTTIKHFAANNQETNRYGSNSQVSERALREIYLRGFEIAVKESQPFALMTSYNLLNGIHTSERRDLIEDVLRAEFGFKGIVMTDWIVAILVSILNAGKKKYPAPDAARIAAAGGDLVMPGSPGDLKKMMKGLKEGIVTRKQLMINATRILRTANLLAGCGSGKKDRFEQKMTGQSLPEQIY